jgi:hypothetical protein
MKPKSDQSTQQEPKEDELSDGALEEVSGGATAIGDTAALQRVLQQVIRDLQGK